MYNVKISGAPQGQHFLAVFSEFRSYRIWLHFKETLVWQRKKK